MRPRVESPRRVGPARARSSGTRFFCCFLLGRPPSASEKEDTGVGRYQRRFKSRLRPCSSASAQLTSHASQACVARLLRGSRSLPVHHPDALPAITHTKKGTTCGNRTVVFTYAASDAGPRGRLGRSAGSQYLERRDAVSARGFGRPKRRTAAPTKHTCPISRKRDAVSIPAAAPRRRRARRGRVASRLGTSNAEDSVLKPQEDAF